MPNQEVKDFYIRMLSNVHRREERTSEILHELREVAQDPEVKEFLDASIYLSENALGTFKRCFKLIGEQPVEADTKLQDVFLEDFHRELDTLKGPVVKGLYIASTASHLMHLRVAEMESLILMSDIAGHPGVGLLLQSVLETKRAFIERILTRLATMVEEQTA